MNTYTIAVVAGDGIGPEVVASGIEIMTAAAGSQVGLSWRSWMPPPVPARFLNAAPIFPIRRWRLAARPTPFSWRCGWPDVRKPDGTELTPRSRFGMLDLYAGIRPRSRRGIPATLAGEPAIDFVIVRESTEGLLPRSGAGIVLGDDVAVDTRSSPARDRARGPRGV